LPWAIGEALIGGVGPDWPGLAVLHEDGLPAQKLAGYLALFLGSHRLGAADADDFGTDLGEVRSDNGPFNVIVFIERRMHVACAGIDADSLSPGRLVYPLSHSAAARAVKVRTFLRSPTLRRSSVASALFIPGHLCLAVLSWKQAISITPSRQQKNGPLN